MNKRLMLCCLLLIAYTNPSVAQIVDKAEDISPLLVGEKIPAASVVDEKGDRHDLSEIISRQPTVLVLFRGSWCPYCSVQLSGLALAEEKILALGYQIVAISPDDFQALVSLEAKTKAKYQLYSDPDAQLITSMGIAFNTGGKRGILPVPSVMVLNQDAEILFEHINPNYKVRIEPEYLIAVLQALKK